MNVILISQKPIQTLNLIYLLGGLDLFPSAVITTPAGNNSRKFNLLDEFKNSLGALEYQCEMLEIPFFVVDDIHSNRTIDILSSFRCDIILSLVTDIILRDAIIEKSGYGIVSSHGGLLPDYRGVDCTRWSILNGEKEVGISTQLINSGIDTGDIVSVKKILLSEIKPCSLGEIERKLFYRNKLYGYLDAVKQILSNGEISRRKQDKSDGKQYYLMHEDLALIVDKLLEGKT